MSNSSSTELIVLSYTKFGENSIVLHTISKTWGRRGFMVRVGKSTSMALFLPLNILEAEVVENSKSTLFQARKITTRYPLNGIRNNIYKNTMTLFMSEVLYRVVKDGVNEEGLFDHLAKQILTLDAIESDFSNFHIRFLLDLCSALGFSPDFDGLSEFAGDNMLYLESFLQSDFSSSMLIPLNGQKRNEICETILRYMEHHLDSAINVRSLKVLHELFA